MLRAATPVRMGSLPTYLVGVDAYDPDKLGLSPMMVQMTGPAADDKWAGPAPVTVLRPMEASVTIPGVYPWVMRWSNTATSQIDWEFYVDNATAAANRRVLHAKYNRLTGVRTYEGFITLTYPTATNHTARALRMKYAKRTRGTAAASGTTVTGTGTQFVTDKICVGSRIGWPSVAGDPSTVSVWYEIASITDLDTLTLTTSAGTIADSNYIIEELQCLTLTTNATAANGGLFLAKGLRPEIFSPTGTTISAAVSTDKLRAVYWLADASTVTNTTGLGLGMEDEVDVDTHYVWAIDTIANPILFKYNINGALTLASGKDTTTLVLKTGAGGALTGTASQANNGRLVNAGHGPGAGLNCIYFTTTTRVYRTADVSTITAASTTWLLDNMTEVPPGSANTFALTAGINSVEYSGYLDKFLILTSTGRAYLTTYQTGGAQFERILLNDLKQIDQGAADSSTTPFPSPNAAAFSGWIEGGMLYLARIGTTAIVNQLFTVPLGCDWEFADANDGRLILPRMACADAQSFVAAYLQTVAVVGGATGKNLGTQPEPTRLLYRTTGISDNSGAWTLLANDGGMAAVAGAPYVQLAVEFRIDGTMVPARVLVAGALFNDTTTDDHWQPSADLSDETVPLFAFRQRADYGSVYPTLRVVVKNAVTGAVLFDDDSVTQAGTWEKSTNGGSSWSAYNTTDRANENTFIRVTPNSIASGVYGEASLLAA